MVQIPSAKILRNSARSARSFGLRRLDYLPAWLAVALGVGAGAGLGVILALGTLTIAVVGFASAITRGSKGGAGSNSYRWRGRRAWSGRFPPSGVVGKG